MKGINLAGADLSPLAPSASTSGRRRQAIGPTYTDLQGAMMSADLVTGYLAYPYDYITNVPIRMDETFGTFLASFRVLAEGGMLRTNLLISYPHLLSYRRVSSLIQCLILSPSFLSYRHLLFYRHVLFSAPTRLVRPCRPHKNQPFSAADGLAGFLGDLSSLDGYDPRKTMAALGLEPGEIVNIVMGDIRRREAGPPEQG
jgi:hypothetical protein